MRLIVDVDGTLTRDDPGIPYPEKQPRLDVIDRVNMLKARGASVVIYTARNMRTHQENIGKINKHTLPILMDWLEKHGVEYDEIYMGKPWCGPDGCYVARNSIRPDNFIKKPLVDLEKWMREVAIGQHGK